MINHKEATSTRITGSLRVEGWGHLDPILLASLATESPLLLIGPHGTAKSLLVERIASVLGLSMRHYNASLLNYDDLVGIPLPEEGQQSLQFVATPSAIWGAQFVFFDEISRCRPDLQNKLFPIIHERKVVGIALDDLQHRWAAMNPPAPEDPESGDPLDDYYLGSEPLDPALTDRFPFIVPVPNWQQLTKEDRRRLIVGDRENGDKTDFSLVEYVEQTHQFIPELEERYGEWLADYLILVIDLLYEAKLPQSPRRARMLAQSILAVHAARMVLEGVDADLSYSAELTLIHGLPQNATEVPPDQATIVAAHMQAWEISSYMEDDSWRQILQEQDLIRRVVLAEELDFDDEDMSRLITQAIGADEAESRRIGLATTMFLAFRNRYRLTPSTWEPLIKYAARVLEPRAMNASIGQASNDMTIWREIRDWAAQRQAQGDSIARIEINYVLSGFPNLWRNQDWKEALAQFKKDLEMFGVREVTS